MHLHYNHIQNVSDVLSVGGNIRSVLWSVAHHLQVHGSLLLDKPTKFCQGEKVSNVNIYHVSLLIVRLPQYLLM